MGALDRVRSAQSTDALVSELQGAATVTTQAVERIERTRPPDDAQAIHEELVTALKQFVGELSQVPGRVESREVCTASSVMASVSSQPGLERLRTVGAKFDAAGYKWGESLPQAVAQQERRLATGQLVVDKRSPGYNEFEVDNGTDRDAVVTLAQNGQAILSMYVVAKTKAKVGDLGDGTYDIFYTAGVDWDEQLQAFTRTCEFARFDEPAELTTTPEASTIWTIGLEPTIGGNVTISEVDPNQYPRG